MYINSYKEEQKLLEVYDDFFWNHIASSNFRSSTKKAFFIADYILLSGKREVNKKIISYVMQYYMEDFSTSF